MFTLSLATDVLVAVALPELQVLLEIKTVCYALPLPCACPALPCPAFPALLLPKANIKCFPKSWSGRYVYCMFNIIQ